MWIEPWKKMEGCHFETGFMEDGLGYQNDAFPQVVNGTCR